MKKLLTLLSTIPVIFTVTSASAQALYWDPGQTASATAGGAGNWDTTSTFWFNGVTDVPWTDGNDAFFEGTAGTVTLMQNSSVADLYFTNSTGGDYVITNDGNNEVLTVANVIDTGGSEDTIATPIANSSTLNKNGDGRLYLAVSNNISGSVNVNQGELSIANINSVGGGSLTVSNGAALEVSSGTNNIGNAGTPSGITANITIYGSGITNSGALRNPSGVNILLGNLTLGQDNSMIYADSGSALLLLPGTPVVSSSEITDNGNNYNLIVSGSGTGNTFLEGPISIGGSLIVQGRCYAYLNGVALTTWNSTYVGPTGQFFVENNNSFGSGSNPASLITTNTILDGGFIASGGSYTMWANDGITATANGGTLICSNGTWTTCNIYSSNAPVTFNCVGSMRPGGAAGISLGTINLGTGAFIKSGNGDCNLTFANAAFEIYSNIVLNGGSLSFNYDASGGTSSLGAVPTTLNASNIVLNGGSMHAGHTTTIGATRGIFVTTQNGTIEDVTSSATLTINSPISGPGSVNFPLGKSGSSQTVVLNGANTYAGTTTVGSSITLSVAGGTGTLGTGNTTVSGTLTFNRTGSYTYGGNISGAGPVNKANTATVTLGGINTYTGATTVSAGTLLINGTNGASAITVTGGNLGGSGLINGAVTVNAAGTLALGTATLSVSNNVSIAGNVSVTLNKSLTPSNGMAVVTGTLANTGTGKVNVTVSGAALVAGDTFQLFSQPLTGGGTMTISGGGTGVVWNNNLAVDGTISVQSVVPPSPRINNVTIINGNFIFSGTNGPGSGTYYVLTSTNVALPISQWTSIFTNTFLGNGAFSITNPITGGNPQQFYLLQVQ
ncbi:MAG TPA: autotransporter-associated beta strand repeat-containing protein [Verrucomicrobiae bacterium]|jgi:autotransporter-associated beta strand protein|nr:autotransporter-associated beta strand repeat-containing protein [Verrucomicrobiae bacterium]